MNKPTPTPFELASRTRGFKVRLAKALNVTRGTVTQWANGSKKLPPARCPDIERLTGIRCEDLRPDIPWSILRRKKRTPRKVVTPGVPCSQGE